MEPHRKLTRSEALIKAREAMAEKRRREAERKERRREQLRKNLKRDRLELPGLPVEPIQDDVIVTDLTPQHLNAIRQRFEAIESDDVEFELILQKLVPYLNNVMTEGIEETLSQANNNSTGAVSFNFARALDFLNLAEPGTIYNLYRLMLTPQAPIYRFTLRQKVYSLYAEALRKIRSALPSNKIAMSRFFTELRKHVVTPAYIAFLNGEYENVTPDKHILPYLDDEEITVDNIYNIFPPMTVLSIVEIRNKPKKNRRKAGWAPWINRLKFLKLQRYQIDTEDHKMSNELAKENCLVYSLRMSGKVPPETLDAIGMSIYGHNLTFISLRHICEQFNLSLRITDYNRDPVNTIRFGRKDPDEIWLGLLDEHFFLNEDVWVSDWVLNNPEEAERLGKQGHMGWHYKVDGAFILLDSNHTRTSGELLKKMKTLGHLVPLPSDDAVLLAKNYYTMKHFDENNLAYPEVACTPIKPRESEDNEYVLFFADFETTTDGACHLPYLLCCMCENGESISLFSYETTTENVSEIWSKKLTRMMMFISERTEPNQKSIVYFHNLNYDMAFIIPYIYAKNKFDVIEVNDRIIGFSVFCGVSQQMVTFRDSYALISSPLRDFGKMFGLTVEKEIFPYDFYTTSNFSKYRNLTQVPKDDYLRHYVDPDELERHLQTLQMVTPEGHVNAHGYSQHYCILDCDVLRQGVLKFREQLKEVTGLDCCNYLTLPSIAYNYLISRNVFDGCYDISAQPQHFIRKCVLGGRCMLRFNEKQEATGDISDFDAVSLYPSAMARIYTLKGKPKIVDPSIHTFTWLYANASGFFVEVTINRVPRELDFPLLPHNIKHGIKEYLNKPGTFYLDDISIMNICMFHEVSFSDITIHRGYFYDEGRNYTIRDVITEIFNKRREFKAQKNPLEKIYKLLMNSCYGKSIIKPVTERVQVVNEHELNNLIQWEASALLSYRQVGDKYIAYTSLNVLKAKSFPTFGVHVLAMSKRIMSEVMVLAQDLSVPIYYTDTDSMHLPTDAIPRLQEAFLAKYTRELIGEDMGQFHTDFPPDCKTKLPTTSQHFIGVGKKCYIDKLVDPEGHVSYLARLKGVPNSIIFKTAHDDFNNDPMELYRALYNGEPVVFDLLQDRVSFQLNRNFTYTSRKTFTRQVNF